MSVSLFSLTHFGEETETHIYLAVIHFACYSLRLLSVYAFQEFELKVRWQHSGKIDYPPAFPVWILHFEIVCALRGLCHHYIFSSTESRSFFWQMDGGNFGSVCAVFKDCF